jgi:hypothetical protein
LSDSAGVPWSGRHFEPNTRSDDDGSAPEPLQLALAGFFAGSTGQDAVVNALRECRLLIPLLAELGEAAVNERGHRIDKSQELSIVTVAGPDGRNVLPVFSSVDTMRAWNPVARPVPVEGIRVALAAAAEGTELVVLDPGSPHSFVVRRPALWAIGRQQPWVPSAGDRAVLAEFLRFTAEEPAVIDLRVTAGDPGAKLTGPELMVELTLIDGLDRAALDELLSRLSRRFADSPLLVARVDSMGVRLARAT